MTLTMLAFEGAMKARDWAAKEVPKEAFAAKSIEKGMTPCIYLKGKPEDFPDLPSKAPNGFEIKYIFN